MKSKRRKVVVLLGLIALTVVCFAMLRPRDEPKYQGRYLSDWMALYAAHADRQPCPEFNAPELSVRQIGTNALPYFIRWMQYEPTAWRVTLLQKRPLWISDNDTVTGWLVGFAAHRASFGSMGIRLLGTNAASIIPDLEVMMKDPTKPVCAGRAIFSLSSVGKPAIPVLQAALADPKQVHRDRIVRAFRRMAFEVGTNTCMPILLEALSHEDAAVRLAATNALKSIAPEVLTDTPSL